MSDPLSLVVNGEQRSLEVEGRTLLVHALRDGLGLTGAHIGCDTSQCGACTVLLDGRRILSCLTLAIAKDGSEVVTSAGLPVADQLHPVQEAFLEHDGLQCGYCTPGQICSAVGMLAEAEAGHASSVTDPGLDPDERIELTDDEIRERMSGNLCRCGAYVNIVAAIREAARSGERADAR